MADDVRLWSDELARDPSSLVFLPLAETLRQQGQLELSRKVTLRGLERHPHSADAHDQLARIHADEGDLQAAFDEWDMVLRLVPGHVGAIKGMAFIKFQQGAFAEAERLLQSAGLSVDDAGISAAIATVRQSGGYAVMPERAAPSDPRQLFAELVGDGAAAIMLDRDGLVLAGQYVTEDGRDLAEEIGVSLGGVSGEAVRATKHLDIGDWRSIVFETEAAVVSLAPAPAAGDLAAGGLMVLAAVPTTPLGLLKRTTERCLARATAWLRGDQP